MATVKTTLTLYPSAIASIVGGASDKAAYRAAQKVRGRAMSNIRSLGRIDTGRMLATLQVRKGGDGPLHPQYTIGSTQFYTKFQEFGTRAHGPVRAPFLVFKPKGSSTYVFAKWVRGVKAGKFMTNAINATTLSDFL